LLGPIRSAKRLAFILEVDEKLAELSRVRGSLQEVVDAQCESLSDFSCSLGNPNRS